MIPEKVKRKTHNLMDFYARNCGFTVAGEPHKRTTSRYSMTTYTMTHKDGFRLYIVDTLWRNNRSWTISVYDPDQRGKPIFEIKG